MNGLFSCLGWLQLPCIVSSIPLPGLPDLLSCLPLMDLGDASSGKVFVKMGPPKIQRENPRHTKQFSVAKLTAIRRIRRPHCKS